MRKLVSLFICCALCSLSVMAQEHLKFKGIPITGSIDEFCEQLKQKDFEYKATDGNMKIFTGLFTGRDAEVGVIPTNDGENVYSLAIVLGYSDSWSTLLSDYEYYKKLYTKKYGTPVKCTEENPYLDKPSFVIMVELSEDEITYESMWKVRGGHISISIGSEKRMVNGTVRKSPHRGVLNIYYYDAINIEEKEAQDLEDI